MVQPQRARGNFKANVNQGSTPPAASHPPPLLEGGTDSRCPWALKLFTKIQRKMWEIVS